MNIKTLEAQLRMLKRQLQNSDTQEEREYWTKRILKKHEEIRKAEAQ